PSIPVITDNHGLSTRTYSCIYSDIQHRIGTDHQIGNDTIIRTSTIITFYLYGKYARFIIEITDRIPGNERLSVTKSPGKAVQAISGIICPQPYPAAGT